MTEQEAIARLRGPKKQMNTIRIAPGHWQTAVIVGEQDIRTLLDREKRLTEALEGMPCTCHPYRNKAVVGHIYDCATEYAREALEGKQ